MRKIGFGGLALLVLGVAGPGRAGSVEEFSFNEMTALAGAVWRGDVLRVRAFRRETPDGAANFTEVTFRVSEVYKGEVGLTARLEFLGGDVAGSSFELAGMPAFAPGEEWVIFATRTPRAMCPVLGWAHGRARVRRPAGGAQVELPAPALRDRSPRFSARLAGHRAVRGASVSRSALLPVGIAAPGGELPLNEFGRLMRRRVAETSAAQ